MILVRIVAQIDIPADIWVLVNVEKWETTPKIKNRALTDDFPLTYDVASSVSM